MYLWLLTSDRRWQQLLLKHLRVSCSCSSLDYSPSSSHAVFGIENVLTTSKKKMAGTKKLTSFKMNVIELHANASSEKL